MDRWTYVILSDHIHLFAAENEFKAIRLDNGSRNGKRTLLIIGQIKIRSESGREAFGIANYAVATIMMQNGFMFETTRCDMALWRTRNGGHIRGC